MQTVTAERDTRDDMIDLGEAVASLDAGQRCVLGLSALGYSQIEIGEVMGVSQQYVSRQLHRVRVIIRSACEVVT